MQGVLKCFSRQATVMAMKGSARGKPNQISQSSEDVKYEIRPCISYPALNYRTALAVVRGQECGPYFTSSITLLKIHCMFKNEN